MSTLADLLDRPIAYHRCLVGIAGVTGAVMLSQALYWTRRTKDMDGWFYKTQEEWEDETGLTRYEQEGARKRMGDVLETELRGIPATLYYRVNLEALERHLANKYGEIPQTGMGKNHKQVWGKTTNINESEITTKTTQRLPSELVGPTVSAASGLPYIPPKETARIEQITRMIEEYGQEKTEQALKTACSRWRKTKRKDNSGNYAVTNMTWVDWAQELLLQPEDAAMSDPDAFFANLERIVKGG